MPFYVDNRGISVLIVSGSAQVRVSPLAASGLVEWEFSGVFMQSHACQVMGQLAAQCPRADGVLLSYRHAVFDFEGGLAFSAELQALAGLAPLMALLANPGRYESARATAARLSQSGATVAVCWCHSRRAQALAWLVGSCYGIGQSAPGLPPQTLSLPVQAACPARQMC